jgi:hypothetical protein
MTVSHQSTPRETCCILADTEKDLVEMIEAEQTDPRHATSMPPLVLSVAKYA